MWYSIIQGVLIPFTGTCLGSACVFIMRGPMSKRLEKCLAGFASGIMVAASFFSLLLPALHYAGDMGRWAFVPAVAGFLVGMLFLLFLDVVVPHMHPDSTEEGPRAGLKRTTKLFLAVTLHNLPEGVAVGVVYAGWLYGAEEISLLSALALAVGIALQNFPEGAIVSLPLRAEGMPVGRTFWYGVLSGVVEPVGAVVTIFAARFFLPLLPYMLSFAAGAMFYVVVEELIPEMSEPPHSNVGPVSFAAGFALMMALDTAFG